MRTPQELRQAVDSMFRIRAVESPPDASGSRRIWHRGTGGAELFTVVDAQGLVLRQELTLFEELVRWDREHGFQRSEAQPVRAEGVASLGRAAGALESYGGADRFLRHLKDRVVAEVRGAPAPPRSRRERPGRPPRSGARSWLQPRWPLALVGLAAALAGSTLAWWLVGRR